MAQAVGREILVRVTPEERTRMASTKAVDLMSFALASNLQYRLKEIDGGTLITLRHSALGLFPDGYREALSQGWPNLFDRVRRRVEKA